MVLLADYGTQMFTELAKASKENPGGGSWIDDSTFVLMTQTEVAVYTDCVKLTESELNTLGVSKGVDYYKGHSRHYTRSSWDEEHDGKTDENK